MTTPKDKGDWIEELKRQTVVAVAKKCIMTSECQRRIYQAIDHLAATNRLADGWRPIEGYQPENGKLRYVYCERLGEVEAITNGETTHEFRYFYDISAYRPSTKQWVIESKENCKVLMWSDIPPLPPPPKETT